MIKNNFAFVFPGQGSQSVGMLADFAEEYPQFLNTFNEASNSLGFDLWDLIQKGPLEVINQYSQPAMLTADVAIWRLWEKEGGFMPAIVAGHSLGEYAALVGAKVLTLPDAIQLVSKRAELMEQAVANIDTAVAVILALDDQTVIDICQKASEGQAIYPINFNLPGQVVIAGEKEATARAVEYAKEAGAKIRELPMSIPSHSPLMAPAAEGLEKVLNQIEFSMPKIPVINNADITIEEEPVAIKKALIKQLTHPIRWVELIKEIQSRGIDSIAECGPKNVLTNMNKRIDATINRFALSKLETFKLINN